MNSEDQGLNSEADIGSAAFKQLQEALQNVSAQISKQQAESGVNKIFDDLTLQLKPLKGAVLSFQAEVKKTVDRYALLNIKDKLGQGSLSELGVENPILLTKFVSPKLAEELRLLGVNFADAAGNVQIQIPGRDFFLSARTVASNPFKVAGRPLKSLSGEASALVIRGVADLGSPIKVSELIDQTGVSRASAYRTLDYCERAGFLSRSAPGVIESFDLPAVLLAISETFGFSKNGNVKRYIAPRGLGAAVEKFKNTSKRYALTGSFATRGLKQISDSNALFIYCDDQAGLASELGLVEVESGGDVFINTPESQVVYQRLRVFESLVTVAPAQIAIDLLGGPGRNPEEGKAILGWLESQRVT